MARYFFDIHNGDEFFQDPEGCECADAKSIRQEVMRTLPEIARHTIPTRMSDTQALMVHVRNETGTIIYTATLSFAGLWLNEPAGA